MIEGLSVLAIVPARSGSKGIVNKNLAKLGGISLIARAAKVLAAIPWIDRRIISTDSKLYAEEAQLHGLAAPFLRPPSLSGDKTGALETVVHALETCERIDNCLYPLIVLAEPTSPLRETRDIQTTVEALLKTGADSAITVSAIDTKCHPDKIFRISAGLLRFYTSSGPSITQRQSLKTLYARNGLCYCFRRETLLHMRSLITENTVPVIIDRQVANIDQPIDLLWAEFLLQFAGSNSPEGEIR